MHGKERERRDKSATPALVSLQKNLLEREGEEKKKSREQDPHDAVPANCIPEK